MTGTATPRDKRQDAAQPGELDQAHAPAAPHITKGQLIYQFRQERIAWDLLLHDVAIERLELPALASGWTFKDVLSHLTTWWRREVACLAAVQRGETPPSHPAPAEVEIINNWIYLTNRDRSATEVLREAWAVWRQFEALLLALPDEVLLDSTRFAWTQGQPLGVVAIHNFVNHLHAEHEPQIHAWLEQ